MNKKRVVKVLLTAAFLGATGIFYSCSERPDTEVMVMTSPTAVPSVTEEASPVPTLAAVSNKVYVHICGQVAKPEVYELPSGARVYDVVKKAGGFTKKASTESVNLARVVVDGEQIFIPTEEEVKQGNYNKSDEHESSRSNSNSRAKENQTVNINMADLKELMTLPGIGEAKASAIMAYRDEHGPFRSTEELMNITGIKNGLYTKIKDYIKVN